jgi:RNA polymerase sigma factor
MMMIRNRRKGGSALDRNEEALSAKDSEKFLNEFIISSRRFILNCASRTLRRFVTDSDDEWSIALSAFHEAVMSYDSSKGNFDAFAALVIRRRLIDYMKSESKYGSELSVEPYALDGQVEEEDEDTPLQAALLKKSAEESPPSARDEIEAVQDILRGYGFSFFELADCSPKSKKTKEQCAKATALLLKNKELFRKMQQTHTLPAREICELTGIPRKIPERHRKYIIAAAEILNGEYPLLAEYMDYIRRTLET